MGIKQIGVRALLRRMIERPVPRDFRVNSVRCGPAFTARDLRSDRITAVETAIYRGSTHLTTSYNTDWSDGMATMRIADDVYEIKSRAVSMFVYTADEPICFDTGIRERDAKRGFATLGLKPERVTHVFLTHTDRDHVGGLSLFTNAHVYLSADEEQMITRTTPRFLGFVYNSPLTQPYTLLKDGDVVQAGGEATIKALATPGHTPGSMSYLVNGAVLFVGDTLVLQNGKARPFSRRHLRDLTHMDTATQAKSAQKLARLTNISLMATAHTGFTTDFKNAMSDWV